MEVEFELDGKKDSFAMNDKLHTNLMKLKEHINKKDFDCVLLVDGAEGTGKSVFAMQLGKAIDSSLTLERVCFTPEEFIKCVQTSGKGQVIIYDEAYTGLASRQSLSEVNKLIVSLMMEMRAKNLVVIIVLPTFFMLDRYVAIFRSRGLFHIYTNKGRRGYFLHYNPKAKQLLYILGRKLMSYAKPRVKFKGYFYGKYVVTEQEYRNKKDYALKHREKEKRNSNDARREFFEGKMIIHMHDVKGIPFIQIAEAISTPDMPIQAEAIRRKYHKTKEIIANSLPLANNVSILQGVTNKN
jgi:hypothetical protein